MSAKIQNLCNFLYSFKKITWTRITVSICMLPFALVLLILVILFLLAADQPGAVVSNSLICASVGKTVLKEGGSAVDAAIATMLCEGVSLPNSAGIGGGFTAILYTNGKFDSLVATPAVPAFVNNVTHFDSRYADGPMAAGIPGELKGYWEMHKKYGILSWKRLFEPSIKLCEEGVPITQWLAGILRHNTERLTKSSTMGKIFSFYEGEQFTEQYKLKFPALAKTLKIVAKEGAAAFYNGAVGKEFVSDLHKSGGRLTSEDLSNYKVIWDSNPPTIRLKGYFKIVTTPLPTSGPVTAFIFNVIKNLDPRKNVPLFWHKTVEAMKHAFGRNLKLSGATYDSNNQASVIKAYNQMLDPDFARSIRNLIKEDKVFNDTAYYGLDNKYNLQYLNGSANICVLSPKGDVVAATSSILAQFGAYFASESTGIIANNLLKRFTDNRVKYSNNVDKPISGRQTYSPYSPTIVLRQKMAAPFFVVGAAGGRKGITLVLTALIKFLLMGETAGDAVSGNFLHNQLIPNIVEYEEALDNNVINLLKKIGHKVVQRDSTYDNFTSVTCIGHRHTKPDVEYNIRVGGSRGIVTPNSDLNVLLVVLIGTLATSVIGLMLYEVLNPLKQSLSSNI